jgi:ribose-phosphate pyrophosphokinase
MRNDVLVFSGRSHPELAKSICAHLGVPLGRADITRFSNENLMVQVQENVREADVFVVQTSSPPVNEHLLELLIFIDALKRASARRVTAVMPYFPYARSDKKDRPRISITARLVADLLEAAGADRVVTMDLHAPQIQGFFKVPVDQLTASPLIAEHVKQNYGLERAVIVATDAGGAKDAGRMASRLNLELAIIDKRRYADDERARAEHLIGDVAGRTAIIVDDEIASGGTLLEAVNFLRARGAERIVAGATHAVLTGNAPERLEASDACEIVLTDTIPVPVDRRFDKLTTLPVAPLFADAIQRIHDGRSVSALF